MFRLERRREPIHPSIEVRHGDSVPFSPKYTTNYSTARAENAARSRRGALATAFVRFSDITLTVRQGQILAIRKLYSQNFQVRQRLKRPCRQRGQGVIVQVPMVGRNRGMRKTVASLALQS